MSKGIQVRNILKWLKLFTYISATILIITGNSSDTMKYLIPFVLIMFLVNYSRDYYLIDGKAAAKYVWASILLELLLIICIGFFDKANFNILFFYIFISSLVISYPFSYAVPIAVTYIAAGFLIHTMRNGFVSFIESLSVIFFSYCVSSAFVMGMSYLVKMQIREKEKLAHMNSELEQAYRKLIEKSNAAQKLTVEQERTRMAREIHDTLAHTLTTLIVQLEACKKLANLDPARLTGELEKAQELSRSGFNDVKRSIKALRPQAMEDKSFLASILSVINDAMENTKVDIKLNNMLPQELKLTSHMEIALFRVIQESITNSIRHGQPGEILIDLKQDNNMINLSIADNGIGCANIKKGFGIQGIRERIESLDGNVVFSSSRGKGFKTKISIPYEVA